VLLLLLYLLLMCTIGTQMNRVDTSRWNDCYYKNASPAPLIYRKTCSRCCFPVNDPHFLPATMPPGKTMGEMHLEGCKRLIPVPLHNVRNCPAVCIHGKNLEQVSRLHEGKHKEDCKIIAAKDKATRKQQNAQARYQQEVEEKKRQVLPSPPSTRLPLSVFWHNLNPIVIAHRTRSD